MSISRQKSPFLLIYSFVLAALLAGKKTHPSVVLMCCIALVGGILYLSSRLTMAITTDSKIEGWSTAVMPVMRNIEFDCTLSLAQQGQKVKFNNHQQDQQQPRFLLLLGLEATGHHLVQKLVTQSPMYHWLEASQIHPTRTFQLGRALFQGSTAKNQALFSATCQTEPMGSVRKPNVTQLFDNVVRMLSEMRQEIMQRQLQQTESPSSIVFPVNVMTIDRDVGQLSYPNFKGPCRPMDSLNLDVWYEVCLKAQVTCQHIYLFRDPYAVVRSSLRRNFERHAIEAIHLYTTHLQLLYAQLSAAPPGTTIGCWNIFQQHDGDIEEANDWKYTMGPLLGWTNQSDFLNVVTKVYHEPSNQLSNAKFSKQLKSLEPYMDSMIRVHDRVTQLCHSQVSWYQTTQSRTQH